MARLFDGRIQNTPEQRLFRDGREQNGEHPKQNLFRDGQGGILQFLHRGLGDGLKFIHSIASSEIHCNNHTTAGP